MLFTKCLIFWHSLIHFLWTMSDLHQLGDVKNLLPGSTGPLKTKRDQMLESNGHRDLQNPAPFGDLNTDTHSVWIKNKTNLVSSKHLKCSTRHVIKPAQNPLPSHTDPVSGLFLVLVCGRAMGVCGFGDQVTDMFWETKIWVRTLHLL